MDLDWTVMGLTCVLARLSISLSRVWGGSGRGLGGALDGSRRSGPGPDDLSLGGIVLSRILHVGLCFVLMGQAGLGMSLSRV